MRPIGMRHTALCSFAAILVWDLLAGSARADNVGQIQTGKRISAATVAVIDPESGTSSGGGTTDVRVAPGDILTFVFTFTPVPNGAQEGMGGYVTDYIPPNTEVVGARMIDRDGNTVPPRRAGLTHDGYESRGSNAGDYATWGLSDGSIAQLYCDTGIFFSQDARTARVPDNAFLRLDNGILMNPEPTGAGGVQGAIQTTAPDHAHNRWDWIHAMAYGTTGSQGAPVSGDVNTGGNGNTPHRYGSAVAGPDTWYAFDTWESAPALIEPRIDVPGPWQRIRYPGSESCTGVAATQSEPGFIRMGVPTTAGRDLSVSAPLPPGTNAVRFAMGELTVGEEYFAEVSLRVLDTPLDPVQNADVNCGEVFGGDASEPKSGKDNPWRYFVPNPGCVQLNLLFDLIVDKVVAINGERLTYTLRVKNLSLNPQPNAVATLTLGSTLVSATGNPTQTGNVLTWNLGTLAPGEDHTFTILADASGGPTDVARAEYDSSTIADFVVTAFTNVGEYAVLDLAMTAAPGSVSACDTTHYTATVTNRGSGPASCGACDGVVVLPAGWTVVPGSARWNGGAIANPAQSGSAWTFGSIGAVAAGATGMLEFDATVGCATAPGTYTADFEVFYSSFKVIEDAVFGVAPVLVGIVQSDPPGVDAPIFAGAVCATGTTGELDGTTITVFVNGIARGTTMSVANAWTVCGLPALFGGQHVTATALATGEIESAPSAPVVVSSGLTPCTDGMDNDMDGFIDFPADPGCASPQGGSEADPVSECSDAIDNDGMNGADWPVDPSCQSAADNTEDGVPACNDGVDNDGDGLIDFPVDPGCQSMNGASEVDLAVCENTLDDEPVPDGFIDFPVDLGCYAAIDADEDTFGYAMGDLSPRLLLVFDTSGSMNWHTCANVFTDGDGSVACPGSDVLCADCPGSTTCSDGFANDSRLDKVKRGITDVIGAFGEVDFALMRFAQRAVEFACPTSNASLSSGGWQGAGAAPCGGGFNAGQLLVGFAPENVPALLTYMDGASNYPGSSPPPGKDVELRGSGTTPIAGSLASARDYLDAVKAADVPFGGCRPYRVILITDGAETCGGDPPLAAGMLAADGFKVHVIGFATPDPQIIGDLNAIALAGGTGQAVLVDDETALSVAMGQIISETIKTELCNGLDDDCDLLIDEGFNIGAACDNGLLGTCYAEGTLQCLDLNSTYCDVTDGPNTPEVCDRLDNDCNGLIDDGIVCTPCVPDTEICNGVDDDCDLNTDENTVTDPLPGVGDTCGIMVGICTVGVLECTGGVLDCTGQGPLPEACNNLDDDCDGFVDGDSTVCYTPPTGCTLGVGCIGRCRFGRSTCEMGVEGPCVDEVGPLAQELCNGIDDDCDGSTDEDWPTLGDACDNGSTGGCLRTGVIACAADEMSTYCTAPAIGVGTEVCNGLDDDCDTKIDEGTLPAPVGNACGGGAGCGPGLFVCLAGEIVCDAGGGGPEVCDNLDNDCDSFIDEDVSDGAGEACADEGFAKIGDKGECEFGSTTCVAGEFVCQGYRGPEDEVCNGKDDDCDGRTDEDADTACDPEGSVCEKGECLRPCDMLEFACGFGFYCGDLRDGRYCLPDACVKLTCAREEVCDRVAGECVDACVDVDCQDGRVCAAGTCVDCYRVPCDTGDVCVANDKGIGVCQSDACEDAGCDAETEACFDGECVDVACGAGCGADAVCLRGECVENPCLAVRCDKREVCQPDTGTCVADACVGVNCPLGQVCVRQDGGCTSDPCATTRCPEGRTCSVLFDGAPACLSKQEVEVLAGPEETWDPRAVLATGGGGCQCGVAGSSRGNAAPAVLIASIAALALGWRRRRRRLRVR